jgi:hypothetical protein
LVYITTIVNEEDIDKYDKNNLFVIRSLEYCSYCGRYETITKTVYIEETAQEYYNRINR